MHRLPCLVLLSVAVGLLTFRAVAADGCILKKGGGYVPERSQIAFIEWKDGQERLFVATKADNTAEPTVWIVPVPANPEHVKAEPMEKFPQVMGTNQLPRLHKRLEETQDWVLLRNLGLFPMGLIGTFKVSTFSTVGGSLPAGGSGRSDVQVHAHVEKHGMVTEVLTARTAEALNQYLHGKQLGVAAAQLTSLKEYIGQECALVCSWRSQAHSTARAVRIDFPTPQIFYPLLPSRVYEHPVPTSIFVRGWVRPTTAMRRQSVNCTPGLWRVEERGPEKKVPVFSFHHKVEEDTEVEPLTRVEVSSMPSQWQTDLKLEPATTVAPAVASFLAARGGRLSFWLNVTLALLLGLGFPMLLIPKEQRQWHDWLCLPLVAASIYFSLFGMALAFWVWSQFRLGDQIKPWKRLWVWLLVLLLGGLGACGGGFILAIILTPPADFLNHPEKWHPVKEPVGRQSWEYVGQEMLLPSLLMVVGAGTVWLVLMISTSLRAYHTLHDRAGWLLIFVILHGALVYFSCEMLKEWLT
jgi:hypothetical protein